MSISEREYFRAKSMGTDMLPLAFHWLKINYKMTSTKESGKLLCRAKKGEEKKWIIKLDTP